jgi:hypothetical protein
MLYLVGSDRVYPPEIVVAMSTAFDNVCRSVPSQINGNDDVRRKLALIILRHVDDGELDPVRLAELAFNDLAGVGQAAAE